MSECMPIPDNWKDFVKEYSFKDIREIYTNGSWLIPTFRVEQMMEHFAKSEWISVKDRLPDDDEPVLVYTKDGVMSVCSLVVANAFANLKNLKVWEDNNGYYVSDVTHWRLLPEYPESE